ncbi:tRNA preQ1(34) S-adenosylmethionine ribosyltransferase-isomerase QueA [bacterium]|nr:tRNA preQ1(34) S-adenosylmethionine ribosyltransferase-isomerase QueA [bacterium]
MLSEDPAHYDYDLPPDRIAQTPLEPRDRARLLLLDRVTGALDDSVLCDLPTRLRSGDCLVLNDTRVSACRCAGVIGSRPVEILIVRRAERSPTEWEIDAMVNPGKKFKTGARVDLGGITGEVQSVSDIGRRILLRSPGRPIRDVLQEKGQLPFPPYITNPAIPPGRYQTCFARFEGSVAAPTAGLHFTPDLFSRLTAAGIRHAFLTLHVGPGTFRPVTSEALRLGRLHPEPYRLDAAAAEQIRETRVTGGRVIAVGTTVCRTLEWIHGRFGDIRASEGETDLFLRPGYTFRAVDGLLTNFHLPRTSLLMLVSALAGRSAIQRAYDHAIRVGYRFYSFGDAMLIL